MWPSTFNKKSATISGWQALGDFAAVKQQLQKIRASTRISSSSKKSGGGQDGSQGASRPLPPLPGTLGGGSSNKSVRFSLPGAGPFLSGSEGSGSDQGYESDQSRERRRQLELPGLLSKLTNFRQKISEEGPQHNHYGHSSGTLTRPGHHDHYGGHSGTLTRYHHKDDHMYYGPIKNLQESDRDMSTSSPVLLEMYDHVKVHPEGKSENKNVKAAIARLASSENLREQSSYDLVLGLVRRPHHSPRPCRHVTPSTPPPPRHHHCTCHRSHHHCNSSRSSDLCRRATALRRTLYKLPGLINARTDFLDIIKTVASEMKLLLDAAGRLAPNLPDQQRQELDLARRKLLETSRSFSNALKSYFKDSKATPVLLVATALVYRTDEIIQALES